MRFALLALIVFVASPHVLSAEYTVTKLGSIPGTSDYSVSGVNDKAEVVGWCTDSDGFRRAVCWSEKAGMIELKMPDGCNNSYACAINNDGLIAGFATHPREGNVACLWQANKEVLKTGPKYSDAKSINELGQLSGSSSSKAVIFTKDFEVKSAIDGLATGLNNIGEIVGVSFDQQRKLYESFFWSEKTGKVALGPGTAKDLNDSGKIVGYANGKATVWDRKGNIYTLPIPEGYEMASAEAVNNAGQVVGSLYGQAVVWQPDNKVVMLPGLEKDSQTYAKAISESGIIAGEAKDSSGRLHAVLWQQAQQDTKAAK